jgi:putative DNA primase/helicase
MPPDVAHGGTLDEWKRAAAAAITADGVPHWTLGMIAGFAGPVLSLTGLDTCGINLSGISSAGKSTAQRLAASAWSTPDIRRPGLCQSARATDNAIEALASRATGTVLSLDELGHVTGRTAAKMI